MKWAPGIVNVFYTKQPPSLHLESCKERVKGSVHSSCVYLYIEDITCHLEHDIFIPASPHCRTTSPDLVDNDAIHGLNTGIISPAGGPRRGLQRQHHGLVQHTIRTIPEYGPSQDCKSLEIPCWATVKEKIYNHVLSAPRVNFVGRLLVPRG